MNTVVATNEEIPEVDAVAVNAEVLGERVRKLRTDGNMTIADLADRAGLSSGLISQIERGRANPSVRTLQRLTSGFGMNLWEFLQPIAPGPATAGTGSSPGGALAFIQRKANRQTLVVGKSRLVKELLSPRNDDYLRFMIITIPARGESEDILKNQGRKGGYMLSGRARLTVGDETGELEPGDSFQFAADVPHKIANPYGEPAVLIWIMSIQDPHL